MRDERRKDGLDRDMETGLRRLRRRRVDVDLTYSRTRCCRCGCVRSGAAIGEELCRLGVEATEGNVSG
ncbi:hypothetical protein ACFX15_027563 [Malus domestica]